MSRRALEVAWSAIEHGASLSSACEAAGHSGAMRGPLLADLRQALSGEARVRHAMPDLRSPWLLMQAARVLDEALPDAARGGAVQELSRAGVDAELLQARHAALRDGEDPVAALAQRASVPMAIARAMLADLGSEAEECLRALWTAAPLCVRANALLATREELRARLEGEGWRVRDGRWSPLALVLEDSTPPAPGPAFEDGWYEVQDEASQLVSLLVAPSRSHPVVDACAGSGGKTLALCAQLGGRGRVLALDRDTRRLKELARRAARAKAYNLLVQESPAPGAVLVPALAPLEGAASRVLVDAPCSGLGALRRKPDLARRVDAALLERLPAQQLSIARDAVRWLRPGGWLVYATCTPLVAENEAVASRLAELEGLELLAQRDWLPQALRALSCDLDKPALRLLPHRHGTDAFTVQVLRRRA